MLEVVDSNAHYRGVCRTMVVEAIEIGALQVNDMIELYPEAIHHSIALFPSFLPCKGNVKKK